MTDQLSGITVVYLIAIGFQIFVLLFIFAKRQIMRFAWGSRKDPYVPIAASCPRKLKREIVRGVDSLRHISVEPPLTRHVTFSADTASYYFRMKTLDDLQLLDSELEHASYRVRRAVGRSLHKYLCGLNVSGIFKNESLERLAWFAERAEFSRKAYGEREYKEFSALLLEVLGVIRSNQTAIRKAGESAASRDWESDGDRADCNNAATQPLLEERQPRSKLRSIFQRISAVPNNNAKC